MLFFHFVLTNYSRNDPHPFANAITHWLACFACTVAAWLAVGAVVGLLFGIIITLA